MVLLSKCHIVSNRPELALQLLNSALEQLGIEPTASIETCECTLKILHALVDSSIAKVMLNPTTAVNMVELVEKLTSQARKALEQCAQTLNTAHPLVAAVHLALADTAYLLVDNARSNYQLTTTRTDLHVQCVQLLELAATHAQQAVQISTALSQWTSCAATFDTENSERSSSIAGHTLMTCQWKHARIIKKLTELSRPSQTRAVTTPGPAAAATTASNDQLTAVDLYLAETAPVERPRWTEEDVLAILGTCCKQRKWVLLPSPS